MCVHTHVHTCCTCLFCCGMQRGHKSKRDEPYHNMCGQFYLYFSNILTHGRDFIILEVHTPTWRSNVANSTHLKLVSIPL